MEKSISPIIKQADGSPGFIVVGHFAVIENGNATIKQVAVTLDSFSEISFEKAYQQMDEAKEKL